MEAKEALEALDLKFSSGNEIPVERATITREEYEAVKAFYHAHCLEKQLITQVIAPPEEPENVG